VVDPPTGREQDDRPRGSIAVALDRRGELGDLPA